MGRLRSPAVSLSPGGKADSQPRVQPFGIINAVLESVAGGSWMAEYAGNEPRVPSPHPLGGG